MKIISQASQEVLVEHCKITSAENLILSIEHSLLSADVEPQRVFFLEVPQEFKKRLYSKNWYWNGTKLQVYEE
ncbi:hypothetical protein [Helicobacter burdigaliensis]|uniref:hypothetical protein n=1 Tax=Helicobacter burdigaliensis TaxID=2315334 RepID=UPI000EF757A1|nr:hypothetical protein [Helicobacter burdigaliensis]